MSMSNHDLDEALGKQMGVLNTTNTTTKPYRDGYIDGWVDMEKEYRKLRDEYDECVKAAKIADNLYLQRLDDKSDEIAKLRKIAGRWATQWLCNLIDELGKDENEWMIEALQPLLMRLHK